MKKINLSFILLIVATPLLAQVNQKWNVGVFTDIVRSENEGMFEHVQAALEVNYQVIKPLSVTSGFEFWTHTSGPGFIAGVRYYPHKNIFARVRRIFFINTLAVGAGWKKPIGKHLNFEAMVDYYHDETVALRVGMSYTF